MQLTVRLCLDTMRPEEEAWSFSHGMAFGNLANHPRQWPLCVQRTHQQGPSRTDLQLLWRVLVVLLWRAHGSNPDL